MAGQSAASEHSIEHADTSARPSTSSDHDHDHDHSLSDPQSHSHSPLPTPTHEQLSQLGDQLSQRLQQSEWKPTVSPWEQTLARSHARFRVHSIKHDLTHLQAQSEDTRKRLHSRKAEFAARRERLLRARELEAAEQRRAEDFEKANTLLRKRLTSVGLALHRRRVHLLRLLEQIYPIELEDPSQFLFSIAAVPLPNGTSSEHQLQQQQQRSTVISKGKEKASEGGGRRSEAAAEVTLKSQDVEVTAAALGLVAQLVTLLSAYLETPVHYPLATAGSRSVVQDAISIMNGPRAFPLYSKGVEGYRFEYAVFLLNKDIEQLVNEHHVPLIDLRQTLPNLKNLIITVISATSPKAYTSPSARRHISARQIALNASTSTSSSSSPPMGLLQLHPHHANHHHHQLSSPSSSTYASPHHHHHQHGMGHLGRGHPFSSSSSTASSSSLAAGPGGGAGTPTRLHSNASVSISVASASVNGSSEITLPGIGEGGIEGRSSRRGAGTGANARSASQASVASTWAASLLGWKTYYGASGNGSAANGSAANGSGLGSEGGSLKVGSTLSLLGNGRGEGEGEDEDEDDDDEGGSRDGNGNGQAEGASAGLPTVRRLGTSKA
ncbi:unnamed protein product [Tilletia caries]|nr:unnamed protein product [Tilletia caries]